MRLSTRSLFGNVLSHASVLCANVGAPTNIMLSTATPTPVSFSMLRRARSVSATDAGEQLLAQLRPALSDIRGVLTSLTGLQSTPIGRIRLLCPRLAAKTVVGPKLGEFVRDYPAVELEIITDDSRVDLVSSGYAAGIQFGEYIAQDMVAVASRPTSGPPSSAHAPTSTHTPSRRLRETCAPSVHPLPAPR